MPKDLSTEVGDPRVAGGRQTLERVACVAGAISALGVHRGDRVAILALNSDRYFELMYALPWIGAVLVPINTRLAAPEIEYILNDSGAVALFVDGAMAHHLTTLDGKIPSVREVVWLDDISSPDGILHYEDLTAYDAAEDVGASFFEVTTAAAFLAFAREPADACVIEVGLGGRLDATNVLLAPVACGIASLGIDPARLAGHTLIWSDGVTTLRLEGDLTLERAVEIAESSATVD